MNLKGLKANWDRFGKADPLWAILTAPEKTGGRWQLDEFFRTGEDEVAWVMNYAQGFGIDFGRARALDFGCGVGRLVQSLANYFDEVCGVDIAPSMIRLAKKYNRHGRKCRYYLNTRADLSLFQDAHFDFIYTTVVLQHMEPEYAKAYLKEFLRVLVPQGILVFNLPSEQLSRLEVRHEIRGTNENQYEDMKPDKANVFLKLKQFVKSLTPAPILDFYRRLRYPEMPIMEMHGIRKAELETFIESNGGRVLGAIRVPSGGPNCISYQYCVARAAIESPLLNHSPVER